MSGGGGAVTKEGRKKYHPSVSKGREERERERQLDLGEKGDSPPCLLTSFFFGETRERGEGGGEVSWVDG